MPYITTNKLKPYCTVRNPSFINEKTKTSQNSKQTMSIKKKNSSIRKYNQIIPNPIHFPRTCNNPEENTDNVDETIENNLYYDGRRENSNGKLMVKGKDMELDQSFVTIVTGRDIEA